MAVVANTFVEGARWFLNLSRVDSFISMQIGGANYNLDIFLTLAGAAVLILLVRRTLGITMWSGPADSIYAVQQSREPLDIRLGMGSTLAAFIAASGEVPSASTVHWFIWRHHDRSSAEVHPDKNRPPNLSLPAASQALSPPDSTRPSPGCCLPTKRCCVVFPSARSRP